MSDTTTAVAGRDATRIRAAKRRRRMFINIAVAALVLVAVVVFLIRRKDAPKVIEGLIPGTVERRNIVDAVSATGSVTAQTGAMVKIGSQITGRIKHLFADVGTQVKAGQTIAELDLPDLQAQVRQAQATRELNERRLSEQLAGVALQTTTSRTDIQRAQAAVEVAQTALRQAQDTANLQVATAQASVTQAQANAKNSSLSLTRNEQLFQKGYVAQADVDNARAQADVNSAQLSSAQENLNLVKTKVQSDTASARAQLDQAQAALVAAQAGTAQNAIKEQQVQEARQAVAQSQAALAVTQADSDKSFIRSPISGTVIQLAQQEGETIAAGLSAPTLIIVADLNRLQVDAFVDETDIGQVRLGQPATITVDAYPKHPFQGRVVKIASGSTMQQNVVTYDVTIALDNPGRLLKPDMTATANIIVAQRDNVLAVPVDAVKPGTKGGSTVIVMTQGPGGKEEFKSVPVQTGVSDGDHTEIVSGLEEGQTVVVSGQVPGLTSQAGGPQFRGPLGLGGPGRGGGTARGR